MFIIVFALIADYLNIPSKIGLRMNHFNYDVISIVIETSVTIVLFTLAYYLIDQWDVNKRKNQEDIAKTMIRTSYKLCYDYIAELDKQYTLDFLVWSKFKSENPDKPALTFYEKYEEVPFDNHDRIMQFASDGLLSKKQMIDYLQIKNLFEMYVTACIVFQKTRKQRETIEGLKQDLLSKIEEARLNLR